MSSAGLRPTTLALSLLSIALLAPGTVDARPATLTSGPHDFRIDLAPETAEGLKAGKLRSELSTLGYASTRFAAAKDGTLQQAALTAEI